MTTYQTDVTIVTDTPKTARSLGIDTTQGGKLSSTRTTNTQSNTKGTGARSNSGGSNSSYRSPNNATQAKRIDGSGNYGNSMRNHVDVQSTEVPGSKRQTLGNRTRVASSNARDAAGKVAKTLGSVGENVAGRIMPGIGINPRGDLDFGLRAGGAGLSLSTKGDVTLGVPGLSVTVSLRDPSQTTVDLGFGSLTCEQTRDGCSITVTWRMGGKIINQDTREADDCREPEPTPAPPPNPDPKPIDPPNLSKPIDPPKTSSTTKESSLKGELEPGVTYYVRWQGWNSLGTHWVVGDPFLITDEYLVNSSEVFFITDDYHKFEITETDEFTYYYETTETIQEEIPGDANDIYHVYYYLHIGKYKRESKGFSYYLNKIPDYPFYTNVIGIKQPYFIDTSSYTSVKNSEIVILLKITHSDRESEIFNSYPEGLLENGIPYDGSATWFPWRQMYLTKGGGTYWKTNIIQLIKTDTPNPYLGTPEYKQKPRGLLPMSTDCCDITKRIYVMLGGDTFYNNGLTIPTQMFTPGGSGLFKMKNYHEIFNIIFRTFSHRTPGEIEFTITDTNKGKEGNQSINIKTVNAQGYYTMLLKSIANLGYENTDQMNVLVRLGVVSSQIMKLLVIINQNAKNLLSFFDVPTKDHIENVDIPFDLSLGGSLQKGFKAREDLQKELLKIVDKDTEEAIEGILDRFLNEWQMPTKVQKLRSTKEGGNFWYFLRQLRS